MYKPTTKQRKPMVDFLEATKLFYIVDCDVTIHREGKVICKWNRFLSKYATMFHDARMHIVLFCCFVFVFASFTHRLPDRLQ